MLSPDSLNQFEQARLFTFHDWYAPELAIIWALINFVVPGPQGMLVLLLALYWGALYVLASAVAFINPRVALILPFIGFMPFTINFAGTIWTDVLLAVSWLMSMALVFSSEVRRQELSTARKVAVWGLFLCGSFARSNALFAAVPLGLYLIKPMRGFRLWARVALTIVLLAGIWFGPQLLNHILSVKKVYTIHSIVTFDLGGISHFSGKNYFPVIWSEEEQAGILTECYNSTRWDTYIWENCKFVYERLVDNGLWGSVILWRAWLFAVSAEPLSYLRHRFKYFLPFMTSRASYYFHAGNTANESQRRLSEHVLFRKINNYVYRAGQFGIYRPINWLILAFGCLALSRLVLPTRRRFVNAVCISSIIYLATYFFVGVSSDFRYAYWSILATSVAIFVVICDLFFKANLQSAANEAPRGNERRETIRLSEMQ